MDQRVNHLTNRFLDRVLRHPTLRQHPILTLSSTATILVVIVAWLVYAFPNASFFLNPFAANIVGNSSLIVVEPETGTVTSPMTIGNDSAASGGKYIFTTVTDPSLLPPPPPPPNPPPPPPSSDPIVAVGGDVACPAGSAITSTNCQQQATANLISAMSPAPAAILAPGDLQYSDSTTAEIQGGYAPSWGISALKSITHPAAGNHEYHVNNAADYFTYWGSAAGTQGQGYYSYNVGTWHIIALNSNCSNMSSGQYPRGTLTSDLIDCNAENTWLQQDLTTHPTTCTLAYWHHSLFSSGSSGGPSTWMRPLFATLYNANADLVLSGHDHFYERFAPMDSNGTLDNARGIREIIVGTGGRGFHAFGSTGGGSQVRNNVTFGILKMTLHPSSYDWQFIPTAGGTFTDSGTGTCH